MATSLDTWFDEVLTDAPGATQVLARQKIRDAAIEFCERSLVWLDDHNPIDEVANQGAYAYAPLAGQIVWRPALVWHDGRPLLPKNKDELAALYDQWTTEVDVPKYFLSTTPDKLRVVPKPAVALVGGLTLMVHYKPARDATTVPDWLYQDYQEAIAAGALARLKAMSRKPFTDPQGAAVSYGFFNEQVEAAKLRAFKAFGRAKPEVKSQFF